MAHDAARVARAACGDALLRAVEAYREAAGGVAAACPCSDLVPPPAICTPLPVLLGPLSDLSGFVVDCRSLTRFVRRQVLSEGHAEAAGKARKVFDERGRGGERVRFREALEQRLHDLHRQLAVHNEQVFLSPSPSFSPPPPPPSLISHLSLSPSSQTILTPDPKP